MVFYIWNILLVLECSSNGRRIPCLLTGNPTCPQCPLKCERSTFPLRGILTGARVQSVGLPGNSNICHFEWIQISNSLCLRSPSGNMWCQLCSQCFKGFIKSAGNTPCLQALTFMIKELSEWALPPPASPPPPLFFFSSLMSPSFENLGKLLSKRLMGVLLCC